jgi:hypothetical protein
LQKRVGGRIGIRKFLSDIGTNTVYRLASTVHETRPGGEIGRRGGLKIRSREGYRFESCPGHFKGHMENPRFRVIEGVPFGAKMVPQV